MKRRAFLTASALALVSVERGQGQEKLVETPRQKPREPDILLKGYSGCLAFSPDSKILAVANGPVGDKQGICFLDPTTGKRGEDFERTTDVKTRRGHGWPAALAFSADGKYFAAGCEGYIAIWDATSGRRLENLELPSKDSRAAFGTVTTMSFSPESRFIFAGRHFWPIDRPGKVKELHGIDGTDGVAFSPDGTHFATRREGIITLWSYPSLHKQKVFGVKDPSGGPLLFTPDGMAVVSEEVYIDRKPYFIWNVTTGEPRYIPFEYKPGFYMDLSPDGTLVAATTSRGLTVMSVTTGRAVHLLQDLSSDHDDGMVDVKFAPNQQILVCSHPSGLRIWKESNGFER